MLGLWEHIGFLGIGVMSWVEGLGLEVWGLGWVAVKELKLSYYIGETLLFTIPIMVT